MSFADDVAEQRKSLREKKHAQDMHTELIDTIKGSPVAKGSEVLPTPDSKSQESLANLHSLLHEFFALIANNVSLSQKSQKEVLQAIQSLDMSPTLNVPKSNITVQSPTVKVDLKPLEDTLRELLTPAETVDEPQAEDETLPELDDFKAQDLKEDGAMQYVGFVHPSGAWYILENDTQANKLRYIFGKSGYSAAFKKAPQYKYMLLNKAINALTS